MTANELIYNIKNLKSSGISTDDSQPSDRQWLFIINYVRERLLTQRFKKQRVLDSSLSQNLGQVPLVLADKNECCEIEDCVLRTKDKIPSILRVTKPLFTYVGNVDNFNSYKYVTPQQEKWATKRKIIGHLPKYIYYNDYIYLVNPPHRDMEYINIKAIFSDPVEATKFRSCDCDNEEPCNDGFDEDYPIPGDLVDPLYRKIQESELNLILGTNKDRTNDGEDL